MSDRRELLSDHSVCPPSHTVPSSETLPLSQSSAHFRDDYSEVPSSRLCEEGREEERERNVDSCEGVQSVGEGGTQSRSELESHNNSDCDNCDNCDIHSCSPSSSSLSSRTVPPPRYAESPSFVHSDPLSHSHSSSSSPFSPSFPQSHASSFSPSFSATSPPPPLPLPFPSSCGPQQHDPSLFPSFPHSHCPSFSSPSPNVTSPPPSSSFSSYPYSSGPQQLQDPPIYSKCLANTATHRSAKRKVSRAHKRSRDCPRSPIFTVLVHCQPDEEHDEHVPRSVRRGRPLWV